MWGKEKRKNIRERRKLWLIIPQKKILSKISLEIKDKIKYWILSHPNVIDSTDKHDALKIGK